MKGKRKRKEEYIDQKKQRSAQDVNELKNRDRINLKNLAQQRRITLVFHLPWVNAVNHLVMRMKVLNP